MDDAVDVAVTGDYAIVVDTVAHSIEVIDISDPAGMTLAGSCFPGSQPLCIALAGDRAFAGSTGGLEVLDISNPASPGVVGSCATPDLVYGVALAGDSAFLACGSAGLQVVNIIDPTSPSIVGSYGTPGIAHGVSVSGDLVVVTDYSGGVHFFDVSDPSNPSPAGGSVALTDWVEDVVLEGHYAFVLDSAYPDPSSLTAIEVLEQRFLLSENVGQSLDVEPLGENVVSATLTSTHVDSVSWELSADGGGNWSSVANGEEHLFATPGGELLWRSAHSYLGTGLDPACTDLRIEYVYEPPIIDAATDVPGDQGGQVHLDWTRSGHDVAGSARPITQYAIYRRIDAAARAEGRNGKLLEATGFGGEGSPERYPPGDWYYVTSVPARTEEEYATVVPTLIDSTVGGDPGYSVFFLRAMTDTPWVYFDSPPDSGYSIDNIPPEAPTGFVHACAATQNALSWDESPDEDFQYFRIYRSTSPDFVPDAGLLIQMTVDPSWIDYIGDAWLYYYKLTAVDFAGNESAFVGPAAIDYADRDFGDAPDPPYRTQTERGGPAHFISPGVHLGALVDAESDGLGYADATGDDDTGVDDEDGVTPLTPFVPGSDVDVEVIASVAGYVSLWLDEDQDGQFDMMFADTPVTAGANVLSFFLDGAALLGDTFMRVRFSTQAGYSGAGVIAPDGEVEDYMVTVGADRDFGDAPDPPYHTLEASGGAYHFVWPGVYLGSGVDLDADGQPDPNALGDDADGSDDEDGVTLLSPLIPTLTADLEVVASVPGYVGIWVDLDQDGAFDAMTTDTPVSAGANTLTVDPGLFAVMGETYMRVRFTTFPGLTSPDGPATDGEVEDYLVGIGVDRDYGDAPDPPYPTLESSGGAYHFVWPGIYLGSGVDLDTDGQPDSLALGDDNDGYDDDDGVTLLSELVPGWDAAMEVVASVPGYVGAWMDEDGDGTLDELFTGTPVSAGANTLSFQIDGDAVPGETYMRVRFTTYPAFAVPEGPFPDGEVEDYLVTIEHGWDFGDAPDPGYPTLFASDGARHAIDPLVYLGGGVDADVDGQPDSLATGDDNDGTDDEDGVTFFSSYPFTPGSEGLIRVTASSEGYLSAWLDGNEDGDWDDSGERVLTAFWIVPGQTYIDVPVPTDFTHRSTFMRFRYSTSPLIEPTGEAPDGEVEDYQIEVGMDFGDAPPPYPTLEADNGAAHYIDWTHYLGWADPDPDGQPDSLALGDDLDGTDDEEGIAFLDQLFPGRTSRMVVQSTGGGFLSAWIDGNADGDWYDPGERVVYSEYLLGGTDTLSVSIPAGFSTGETFARFRFSSVASSVYYPTGVAPNGEVEDHAVTLWEYSPATIDIQPASLVFEVEEGQVVRDTLIVSNLGTESLYWTTREDTAGGRGASGVPRGSGGSDAFGYRWIDSDDPGGPTYGINMPTGWEDLALGDDDVTTVGLPFPFPFYGKTETYVSVTSEGYIVLGDGDVLDYNVCIPTADPPNNIVAPLWGPYDLDYAGYVYYNDTYPDRFGVYYIEMWHSPPMYASTFAVELRSNGSILFHYDLFEDVPEIGTIGIENSDGTIGLQIACNEPYAHDEMAVLIADPCPWLIENPADGNAGPLGSFAAEVWVDATDLSEGVYEGEIVFVSNDAANPDFSVPVTLNVTATGVDGAEDTPLPVEYRIRGNYPNPFNPTTVIAYELPARASVDLRIYDVSGRLVRTLESGRLREAGTHTATWDGRDDGGALVSSGVYFCRMAANGEMVQGRMVLLK